VCNGRVVVVAAGGGGCGIGGAAEGGDLGDDARFKPGGCFSPALVPIVCLLAAAVEGGAEEEIEGEEEEEEEVTEEGGGEEGEAGARVMTPSADHTNPGTSPERTAVESFLWRALNKGTFALTTSPAREELSRPLPPAGESTAKPRAARTWSRITALLTCLLRGAPDPAGCFGEFGVFFEGFLFGAAAAAVRVAAAAAAVVCTDDACLLSLQVLECR